jgi:hypothetical protein
MALDSYANLKTAIADHLNRSDLTSQIDDFLDIAEARHKREIRIREMLERASITVDDRLEDLPTGFLEPVSLRLMTSPVTVLTYVAPYEMTRLRNESTGRPAYFTIHDKIEFDVEPEESYTAEMLHWKALTPLSGAATSNALLVLAPDLYLYASLVAASPFLLADERIPVWNALYMQGKEAVNAMARASRKVGPLVSRVAGATP